MLAEEKGFKVGGVLFQQLYTWCFGLNIYETFEIVLNLNELKILFNKCNFTINYVSESVRNKFLKFVFNSQEKRQE